jgi:hypothetical protein
VDEIKDGIARGIAAVDDALTDIDAAVVVVEKDEQQAKSEGFIDFTANANVVAAPPRDVTETESEDHHTTGTLYVGATVAAGDVRAEPDQTIDMPFSPSTAQSHAPSVTDALGSTDEVEVVLSRDGEEIERQVVGSGPDGDNAPRVDATVTAEVATANAEGLDPTVVTESTGEDDTIEAHGVVGPSDRR